ncbi:MAG: glycerate kinase [Nitrososphaerota archaeon]|nr:glycerate kinase [Nitrososphaerota archaeon]
MGDAFGDAAAGGDLRGDALAAVRAAIDAADPRRLVLRELSAEGGVLTAGGSRGVLEGYRRVVVVGGGKASALMAAGVERVLGARVDGGVVIVPEYQRPLPKLRKVKFAESTHPLPSEKGARAVREMLGFLSGVGAGDLVIVLVSGGGSALMPAPIEGVTLKELELTTSLLLRAGAEIGEVNCVRKHLSEIAGGRLVEKTNGAEVLTLLISDVVGDDLSSVASGPTVPDPTTFSGARRILTDRGIWSRVPQSVRDAVREGAEGSTAETPKPGDRAFRRVTNVLVGSNDVATTAASEALRARGYRVTRASSVIGEARDVGKRLAALARATPGSGRWAAVWGGETTVTVRGNGIGGRNQELALAAAIELKGTSGIALVSFGTDGVDGPTDAAGALADSVSFDRARAMGLDPRALLENNDSHSFFRSLGDLVVTGPTGTNVNDVMLAIRS